MTGTTDNNVQTNKHDSLQIVGRTSSHFTRVAVIFATELGVRFELVPVYDLSSLETGGHTQSRGEVIQGRWRPARRVKSVFMVGLP